jgi:hypothetical protein
LRQSVNHLTGLDPLPYDLSGDRIELAAKASCEKLDNELVFGRMVVMATLDSTSTLLSVGEVARASAGVLLSSPFDGIDLERIKGQKVLITEKGTIIQSCGQSVLPDT